MTEATIGSLCLEKHDWHAAQMQALPFAQTPCNEIVAVRVAGRSNSGAASYIANTRLRQQPARALTCGTRSWLAGCSAALPALLQRQPPAAGWRPCGCVPGWTSCACCRWREWIPAAVPTMLCGALLSRLGACRAPALLCNEPGRRTSCRQRPRCSGWGDICSGAVTLVGRLCGLEQPVPTIQCGPVGRLK